MIMVGGLDADFGPMDFLSTDSFHEFEQSLTQEFVITSPTSDSFEYIAGVYYEDDIEYGCRKLMELFRPICRWRQVWSKSFPGT